MLPVFITFNIPLMVLPANVEEVHSASRDEPKNIALKSPAPQDGAFVLFVRIEELELIKS
jgi:hypothetical protein